MHFLMHFSVPELFQHGEEYVHSTSRIVKVRAVVACSSFHGRTPSPKNLRTKLVPPQQVFIASTPFPPPRPKKQHAARTEPLCTIDASSAPRRLSPRNVPEHIQQHMRLDKVLPADQIPKIVRNRHGRRAAVARR